MTDPEPRAARAEPVLDLRGLTVALPKGADGRHTIETVSLAVHPQELPCLFDEPGSAAMGLLPSPGRTKSIAAVPGERLGDD